MADDFTDLSLDTRKFLITSDAKRLKIIPDLKRLTQRPPESDQPHKSTS